MPLPFQINNVVMLANYRIKILLISSCIVGCLRVAAQDLSSLYPDSADAEKYIKGTFNSDYILTAQSNETLFKHELRLNVTHRFDDLAGQFGGVKTFFGIENSTDIKIGVDYGVTDRLTLGLSRAKGSAEVRGGSVSFNSLTQLFEGKMKYKLLKQTTDNRIPLSLTGYANAVVSTRAALDDSASDAHFEGLQDRWSFMFQLILARKFNSSFSIAILPTYIRRNFVAFKDMNGVLALGIGARWKLTPRMALVADYFIPFRSAESDSYFRQHEVEFYHPFSIGWEIVTGGHIFHISISNSTAILENQFIPYTTRNWKNGEFRLGFDISRSFTLEEKHSRH